MAGEGRWRRVTRGSWQSAVVTAVALAWARCWGGRPAYDEEAGLFVCAGMRGGFARGGTTYGGVYLTGHPRPGRGVLRHEAVHADQWARHGIGFALRYLLEEARRPGARNRFEIEAGLRDGGYREPPPGEGS
ncbi:hypothetical protein GHK92_14140 [Nocardioides sp. dk4132]|nr:hypothetical protein [Nocardioides sp. dk4132]QGA09428.1 hypothetical protein GFH29_20045 [Nocardioides sp. dk884]